LAFRWLSNWMNPSTRLHRELQEETDYLTRPCACRASVHTQLPIATSLESFRCCAAICPWDRLAAVTRGRWYCGRGLHAIQGRTLTTKGVLSRLIGDVTTPLRQRLRFTLRCRLPRCFLAERCLAPTLPAPACGRSSDADDPMVVLSDLVRERVRPTRRATWCWAPVRNRMGNQNRWQPAGSLLLASVHLTSMTTCNDAPSPSPSTPHASTERSQTAPVSPVQR
jgi:hypothetical protein